MMESKYVYCLNYFRPLPDGTWAATAIGVYSSLARAEQAAARLRERPGFRDYPDGFDLSAMRVDVDYDDPMFFDDAVPRLVFKDKN
jgi:hypothetical protein